MNNTSLDKTVGVVIIAAMTVVTITYVTSTYIATKKYLKTLNK